MGFAAKPSNYGFLKELRKSKTASLKPCSFLKESTKLRYYQVVGCLHLMSLSRMVLGDSAGLGKTLQAIASFCYNLLKDPTLKLLIVTPKSAMEQWAEEVEKFCTGISVHVLSLRYAKAKDSEEYDTPENFKARGVKCKILRGFEARLAQYRSVNAQILISNYHPVQEDYTFLIENREPRYAVIYDECQEFKNDKTKTWFGAKEIADKAQRAYGLSATIIKNRLEEAYNIYKVIVPGLFGGKTKFHDQFTVRKKMSVGWGRKKRYFNKIVGYKNLKEFKERIDPFFLIRRTREVADELPHLISKKVILEMTEKQAKLYKEALSGELFRRLIKAKYFEFQEYMDGNPNPTDKELDILEKLQFKYDESLTAEGLAKNKIAALSYCQLVSNGPGWLKQDGESSKEKEFKRLFEQELSTEKVIVFTRFKSGIPRLEAIMDELELKHEKITGDSSGEERKEARLKFSDSEKDVNAIFITYAGSAALNLQSANVILFYDTPWSYGDLYQTIGRAQRIGSIYEHVHLIHMVNTKTID